MTAWEKPLLLLCGRVHRLGLSWSAMARSLLALSVAATLAGCPLSVRFAEAESQYDDGIERNFHKWRGYN